MTLLRERGVAFTYRDYDKEPLSEAELREVLGKLGARPRDVLRKRDKAYKALGLTGDEPDDTLLRHLAANPGLLQRPIGVRGDWAVLGRPVDKLLELGRRRAPNPAHPAPQGPRALGLAAVGGPLSPR